MRPMAPWPAFSVNHRLPSGPVTMSFGALLPDSPLENSVISPVVVIRPILPAAASVNQSAPSGPFVMELGSLSEERPAVNSVMLPPGVIRPIRWAALSTYQRFLSGPTAMSVGSPGVGTGNSVTSPAFVTCAIAPSPPAIATQRFPSGPVTMPRGLPVGKPALNSVITASGVMRPTALWVSSENQRFPSGPVVMPHSPTPDVRPSSYSDIAGPVASAVDEPSSVVKTASETAIRIRTEPVSGRAVRFLMQRSSGRGRSRGEARSATRAVLRPGVRVRADPGHGADGRQAELERPGRGNARAGGAVVGVGGVRVAHELRGCRGGSRAASDPGGDGRLPGRGARGAAGAGRRRARLRGRLRGGALAAHLHLRRGERGRGRLRGDPAARADGPPGAADPDRCRVPRRDGAGGCLARGAPDRLRGPVRLRRARVPRIARALRRALLADRDHRAR